MPAFGSPERLATLPRRTNGRIGSGRSSSDASSSSAHVTDGRTGSGAGVSHSVVENIFATEPSALIAAVFVPFVRLTHPFAALAPTRQPCALSAARSDPFPTVAAGGSAAPAGTSMGAA